MSTCQKSGCAAEATHALKIVVPDVETDRTCSECVLSLELCCEHIESARASDFFDAAKHLKDLLTESAAPDTQPDFPEAYVEGVPLGSQEHQAFRNLNRKAH